MPRPPTEGRRLSASSSGKISVDPPKQPFAYSTLPEGHIRLLRQMPINLEGRLCCTLQDACLDEVEDRYDAFSYAWQGQTPTISIICNSQPLLITRTLYDALHELHKAPQARPFWIDAVCINQVDDEEKAVQVPLMGSIYSRAFTVIVWLGIAGPCTDEALDAISSLNTDLAELAEVVDVRDMEAVGLPTDRHPIWDGLLNIFKRTWFRRLWALQEIVLAKNGTLLCGSRSVTWHETVVLVEALARTGLDHKIDVGENSGKAIGIRGRIKGIESMKEQLNHGQRVPFSYLTQFARSLATTEAVDKVYAIMSLAEANLCRDIRIDYSSESREKYWNVYLDLGHVLLQELTDLYCLTLTAAEERPVELPSWCPNFKSNTTAASFRWEYYEAGGPLSSAGPPHIATSIDRQRIMVQGSQVDQVMEVGLGSWEWFTGASEAKNVVEYAGRGPRWIDECLRMQRMVSGSQHGTTDALLRTLVANLLRLPQEYAPDSPNLEAMFTALEIYLEQIRDHSDSWSESLTSEILLVGERYLYSLDFACKGRVVFATHEGRLGLGPRDTQSGDMICVFRTCQVPLILRKGPEEEYFHLVGEAYVHGIMHREALEAQQQGLVQETVFTIA